MRRRWGEGRCFEGRREERVESRARSKSKKQEQEQEQEENMSGRVKWFDAGKGYGFIERDDGEKDVFVHHSSIEGGEGPGKSWMNLDEGDVVEFDLMAGKKGEKAGRVRVVGKSVRA